MAKKITKIDFFKNLSWDDLIEWAGSKIVSRGQDYQKSGHVKDLSFTPDGALIAWVLGTHRYATLVDVQKGELISDCNCPYDDTCKHAVAVVLEGLDYLKKKKEIPLCSKKDRRLESLDSLEMEDELEEGWEEEDEEEEEKEVSIPRKASSASKSKSSGSLQAFLEDQTKPQLINLIQELANAIPELNQALGDRQALSKGTVNKMVQSIRREITTLSSEPGWRSHWKNEGYIPDYSRVQERLEALLAQGYADEVVSLGKELLEAGTNQVGMSDDDGETAMEISPCLEIVFRALSKSTLSPIQQMIWAVDAELKDEYDLCQDLEHFWKQKFTKEDWNKLADIFMERLNSFVSNKKEDEFSSNYTRDSLSDWVIQALQRAGRQKEIIPLCEQEAEKTGSYTRLVNRLVEAKRPKEAEHWIQKGITVTEKKWPGLARGLRDTFRKIREKEGNRLQAASFRAEDFFHDPTLITFEELQKSADKAKVWPEVRAAAMHYLETGKPPQKTPSWPLPICEIPLTDNQRKKEFPILHTLIDIAIAEKDAKKVLHWYDWEKPKTYGWRWGFSQDERVAKAVADEYPDRAVAIWKKLAENLIAQTKPKAYEEAAVHLRKISQTLKKLNRPKDWQTYLTGLRQK
ncbi:MAG: SWIM zinc finger family protein, partial [Deltaproteobacteria bacterium]|nr:SWIM zinc finger family protein [Deltaproteobacteria bacterium]